MNAWQPITIKELEALVEEELANCSVEQRKLFEHCSITPRPAPIHRNGNIESVFVVAQVHNCVLYYEDVEGGFNISQLSLDGGIATPGYEQWPLCHALKQLVAA